MSGPITDQITIHVVTDFAPNTVWIHTQGMAKFNYPDLEWYWSPRETWTEGAQILNRIAYYAVEMGQLINVGDTMSIERLPMNVEFLPRLEQEDHTATDNQMLRVRTVTASPAYALACNNLGNAYRIKNSCGAERSGAATQFFVELSRLP
jgi:hypothetical protein